MLLPRLLRRRYVDGGIGVESLEASDSPLTQPAPVEAKPESAPTEETREEGAPAAPAPVEDAPVAEEKPVEETEEVAPTPEADKETEETEEESKAQQEAFTCCGIAVE